MKKNKKLTLLILILVTLLIVIVMLLISIKNKSEFKKIAFDNNALDKIPDNINYEDSVIKINDNYSLYINPMPEISKKEYLKIDLISLVTNDIWIKVRVLDKDNDVIAETGLIKPGEYLEFVKLKRRITKGDSITYKIMGYEMDSYYSAGSVNLNTKASK